jgi:hypothetical protein
VFSFGRVLLNGTAVNFFRLGGGAGAGRDETVHKRQLMHNIEPFRLCDQSGCYFVPHPCVMATYRVGQSCRWTLFDAGSVINSCLPPMSESTSTSTCVL